MIYVPKYFDAPELVDRNTFRRLGAQMSFTMFRPELLKAIDALREHLGKPIFVNSWEVGGKQEWRGLRTAECKIGAVHSPHRVGAALDFDVQGMTADEVCAAIRAKYRKRDSDVSLVRRVEIDTDWVHIDVLEHNLPGMMEFSP